MTDPAPDPLRQLPPSLQDRLRDALRPGEAVLYAGMPGVTASMRQTLVGFVFGIGWSAIAFTFQGVAIASLFSSDPVKGMGTGMGLVFCLFALPFTIIGIGLLAWPFHAAWTALLTVHAVTDRRLLTVTGGRHPSVESRSAQALTFVHRVAAGRGRGTLRLGFGTERDSDGDPRAVEVRWPGIPAVDQAEEAVRLLAASMNRTI